MSTTFADELIASAEISEQAAEDILFQCASEKRQPNRREAVILANCGIAAGGPTNDELRRVTKVISLMEVVETQNAVAIAERDSDAAAAVCDDQVPQLESQIAALQKQLAALEAAKARAQTRVETLATAMRNLQSISVMPLHIVDRYNEVKRSSELTRLKQSIVRLENRATMERGAMTLPAIDPSVLHHCRANWPDAVVGGERVDAEKWAEVVAYYKRDSVDCEASAQLFRTQYNEELAEQCRLDQYTKRLPQQ